MTFKPNLGSHNSCFYARLFHPVQHSNWQTSSGRPEIPPSARNWSWLVISNFRSRRLHIMSDTILRSLYPTIYLQPSDQSLHSRGIRRSVISTAHQCRLHHGLCSPGDRQDINRAKIHLHVLTVSDSSNGSGTNILPSILQGRRDQQSQYKKWPRQPPIYP